MSGKIISPILNIRLANSITLTALAAKVIREKTGSFHIDMELAEELGWQLSAFVPEGIELICYKRKQITAQDIEQWISENPHLLDEAKGEEEKQFGIFPDIPINPVTDARIAPDKITPKKTKVTIVDNRRDEQ